MSPGAAPSRPGAFVVGPRASSASLATHPSRRYALHPDKPTIAFQGKVLTHRQFNVRVNSLVNAFCRDHLAGFKKPKSVEFQEELPKSPASKILKRELRERY